MVVKTFLLGLSSGMSLLAKMVERETRIHKVVSSIPVRGAICVSPVTLVHTSHKHTDKNITNNKQYKVQCTKDKHMTAEV